MATGGTEVGELWRSINREMQEAFRHAYQGYEFSPINLVLFRHIHKEPGITINELARRAGIVKSHVSKMIDNLVQQELVEKRPDPDDQRLVRLYLTQAADGTKSELENRAKAVFAGVLSEIPDAEVDALMHGLRTLLKALQQSNEKVNT